MLIIPKDRAVVKNLDSYFVNLERLFEHCQQEVGSGFLHFKSPAMEGVIFFEGERFLNGIFQDGEKEITGKEAIDSILEASVHSSLKINIYRIQPDMVWFWANLPSAEKIYQNLSSDFIDLDGLLKKMSAEKLTGFIDVTLNEGKGGGILLSNKGKIIGGSYSWCEGEISDLSDHQENLINQAKEWGGIFHVSSISLSSELDKQEKEIAHPIPSNLLSMLEGLLIIFEKEVVADKKLKGRFHTLLKNKFIEKADRYLFLNPFSDKFQYVAQKIRFNGNASDRELANGVVESVKELAEELGILSSLTTKLVPWAKTYQKELATFGLTF